jgi:hypothetical protein
MQEVIRMEVAQEGAAGQLVRDARSNQYGGLVCPTSRDIVNRIPAPTEDQERYVEVFDEPYAISVCGNREVEGPNFVAPERIGSTLQNDDGRAEGSDDGIHDLAEDSEIGLVVDAIGERHIEAEVLAMSLSAICPLARTGEERAVVLVKGRREDAIR